MTPAARVQASIELIDEIERSRRAAGRIQADYVRARRYIGAKDRRAIEALTFAVVRDRARLAWWLNNVAPEARGDDRLTPRLLVLAALARDPQTKSQIAAMFDAGGHGPAPLGTAERAALAALTAPANDWPAARAAMPAPIRDNYPSWLVPELTEAFADDLPAEMAALDQPAAVDVRVNQRRADRDSVLAALGRDGIDAAPTPLSPLGIRVNGHPPLTAHRLYRQGLIEVQEESAQLAALLVDASGAGCVVDYCAGAGGKTLALAAAMAGRGRLIACDRDPARLARLALRFARAGEAPIERQVVQRADDPWVLGHHRLADRLLLDVPCSGSGTWRRHPEARNRLSAAELAGYRREQDALLAGASALVKPGGRLIYVTCSILPSENQHRVTAFLESKPDFEILPLAQVWRSCLPGPYPGVASWLTLTPRRHGCDGMFVAILTRH